jgi:hypothetical protein
LSFASTSETTPENVNEARLRTKLKEQHEKANCVENYSLDDHIIDYELRRVKERRAHEEVLSGRYRHPAFISRNTQGFYRIQFFFHSHQKDFSLEMSIRIKRWPVKYFIADRKAPPSPPFPIPEK